MAVPCIRQIWYSERKNFIIVAKFPELYSKRTKPEVENTLENLIELSAEGASGENHESLRQRDRVDNIYMLSANQILQSRLFTDGSLFFSKMQERGKKMEMLLKIVQTINAYLSDYVLVFLLIGVGIFYSVKTRFIQVRCFGEGMKMVFGDFTLNGKKHKSGISSFQALATAIAAQVGTGNIIGASGAILTGGPGAIFWMWIIAFFGMATIYAEAVLAQDTRVVKEDGSVLGGPVYYITKAFTGKFGHFLACFFSVSIILALGFTGCMVQSNSIGETASAAFGLPSWVFGIAVAAIAGFIFIGGVSRIAAVTEKLVPMMAAIYLLGGLIVIVMRFSYIPETFAMIFRYAFTPNALIGGSFGYALKTAISQGAKRGLFSNEAGMGSTPHAHAMANVKNPHEQGVVAMIGVFIDTFVVVSVTALVIISTLYAGNGILASGSAEGVSKANMAQLAFSSLMGDSMGSKFVAICLLFFAFSTIISWNFFGKINVEYLLGKKAVPVYSLISVLFIVAGSCLSNDLVWELSDMFNQLMVLPNALALFMLSGMVVKHVK